MNGLLPGNQASAHLESYFRQSLPAASACQQSFAGLFAQQTKLPGVKLAFFFFCMD
jgi:hypothetical protein